MKTFTITKSDIDEHGCYVGDINTSEEIDGDLIIDADLGCVHFKKSLMVKYSIFANAGSDIKAVSGSIYAGHGIKAGHGIEAGRGIEAGLSIIAKTVSSQMRIFAGLAIWKQPKPEEMQVRARLICGEIAFGELIEPEIFPIDLLRPAVETDDMGMTKEALAAFESAAKAATKETHQD